MAQARRLLLALGQPDRREVDSRHPPAERGQPHGVATLAGAEVQRPTRRPAAHDPLDLGVGGRAPDVLVRGIPLVPERLTGRWACRGRGRAGPGSAGRAVPVGVLVPVAHPPSIADMSSIAPRETQAIVVRDATPADLPAMAAVYDDAGAHLAGDLRHRAARRGIPRREARRRRASGNVVLVACTPTDELLGYAFSGPFRPRPAYDGHQGGVGLPRRERTRSRSRPHPVCRAAGAAGRRTGRAHPGGRGRPAQRRERGAAPGVPASNGWGSCGRWGTSSVVTSTPRGTNG